MNQPTETFPQGGERPKTEEELVQLLAEAQARLEETEKQASQFYDVELEKTFDEAREHFKDNSEALNLYLRSIDIDDEKAEENASKKLAFEKDHLLPIKKETQTFERDIRLLKNAAYRSEQEQLEKERREKEQALFLQEKQALEEKLFAALDAIHQQIPQEARDAGMTTEAALKVYLSPLLIDRAHTLERLLNELDTVDTPFSLTRFKKDMDFREIGDL